MVLLPFEADRELHARRNLNGAVRRRIDVDRGQRQMGRRAHPELFVTVLSCEHRLGGITRRTD